MSARKFTIPAIAMNVAMSAGCTPAIVGDWSLTELKIDGDKVDLSYSYSGYYGDIDMEITGDLSVDSDLSASFDIKISYSGYYSGSYKFSYDGDAESNGGGEFNISMDGDDSSMDVDCTVDGNELSCDGDMGDASTDMVFESD